MPNPMLHIFMAEDDQDDIDLFREALLDISKNALLTTSSNGARILSMLRQVTPDIIYLDINMPIMNGIECLRKIREIPTLHDVPIIIYSTAADGSAISEAFKLGANRYVKKPASFAAIKKSLQEILELPKNALLQPSYPGDFYSAMQ